LNTIFRKGLKHDELICMGFIITRRFMMNLALWKKSIMGIFIELILITLQHIGVQIV